MKHFCLVILIVFGCSLVMNAGAQPGGGWMQEKAMAVK